MSRILRRAFLDICNGYSLMIYNNETLYIKHLSHKEHLDLDDLQEKYFQLSKSKGLPDEAEQLLYLKKEGLWTEKDQLSLVRQESMLARMVDGKRLIALPSMLERHNKDIAVEEEKLNKLKQKQRDLIGLTCEIYASKVVNEHYIIKSLYRDQKLTIPYFLNNEFDDIEDDELNKIVNKYNESVDPCSEKNIKKLSIQDFFQSYYFICNDDFFAFFGRPIFEFTYFQVKLANFARFYKNIMEGVNIRSLPKKCLEDPDYLEEYLNTTKKGKEMIDNTNGQAVSIIGATKEDLRQIAGQGESSVKIGNKEASMNDLMKQFGK